MVKILSQAGNSLADTYDVQGSVAGIEQLETRELPIVHEMGGTVFSERLGGAIVRVSSGAIAQNTNFDVVTAMLPAVPTRVLGVMIFNGTAARTSFVSVSVNDEDASRDMPIFLWDSVTGVEVLSRLEDGGSGVININVLASNVPLPGAVPTMQFGADQPEPISSIAFRGRTLGFGAGTIENILYLYQGFAQIGGISSRGLPVPSW